MLEGAMENLYYSWPLYTQVVASLSGMPITGADWNSLLLLPKVLLTL
jgi:hypothetical protein